jgi:hypothetical protein
MRSCALLKLHELEERRTLHDSLCCWMVSDIRRITWTILINGTALCCVHNRWLTTPSNTTVIYCKAMFCLHHTVNAVLTLLLCLLLPSGNSVVGTVTRLRAWLSGVRIFDADKREEKREQFKRMRSRGGNAASKDTGKWTEYIEDVCYCF